MTAYYSMEPLVAGVFPALSCRGSRTVTSLV
jgi:hypothetical protein